MIKFKTFLHKKVTQKEKELGTPQRTKRFENMTPGQVEENYENNIKSDIIGLKQSARQAARKGGEARFVIFNNGNLASASAYESTHYDLGGGYQHTNGTAHYHPHSRKYSYIAWNHENDEDKPHSITNDFEKHGVEQWNENNPNHAPSYIKRKVIKEIAKTTVLSYLNKAQDKSRYFSDPNRLETRLKSFTLAQKKIGQSKDKPKIMAKNKSKMVAEKDYTAELEAQKKRQEEERNLRGVLERHYPDSLNHSEVGDFVNDSSMINHHHWEVHKGTRKSSDRIFPYDEKENHISETIDKLTHSYKTPQAMTVWSKSRHDPRILKNNEGIVHHPAFLSTSLKKSVAEQTFQHRNVQKKDEINHHHVLKINVPEGKHGYYVNNDYNEFVLPRGTNLKYHSTDTHGDSKNIYHTHHMEVI